MSRVAHNQLVLHEMLDAIEAGPTNKKLWLLANYVESLMEYNDTWLALSDEEREER